MTPGGPHLAININQPLANDANDERQQRAEGERPSGAHGVDHRLHHRHGHRACKAPPHVDGRRGAGRFARVEVDDEGVDVGVVHGREHAHCPKESPSEPVSLPSITAQ